jgi:ABC-type transport system involved in multi-copper enzyme maturation permease subunit
MAHINTPLQNVRNPIFWQEFVHQTRNAPYPVRRENLIIANVAAFFVLAMIAVYKGQPSARDVTQFALFAIWGLNMIVSIRAVIAGANAVSREHVNATWDTLIMTGVSAGNIAFGKWWAAMQRVGMYVVALAVVRIAAMPIFMLAITERYIWWTCTRNPDGCDVSGITWVAWSALLAPILAILMTLLEVAACTALGVACNALFRRGSTAAVFAITLRFLPVATFAIFTQQDLAQRYGSAAPIWRWWRHSPFSLADAGTTALMRMTHPILPSWTQGQHLTAFENLLLPTFLLGTFLLCSLVLMWVASKRGGALGWRERQAGQQPNPIPAKRLA